MISQIAHRFGALRSLALLCTAVAGLVGCGRPAGVILEPRPDALAWPPPPDTARIRHLGQLETDRDLKPARRGGKRLGEFLFGEDASHAMLSPIAVAASGESRIFIADSNGQVLHVFDIDSRRYQQWRPGPGRPPFSMPVAVASEPDGGALVSDSVAGVIFDFDAAGTCTGTIGAGVLQRPCGLVSQPDRILVVDSAAHQIVVLSRTGREVARVGRRGVEPGAFNFPTNLVLDAAGRLYVSDTLNFRIQVFDPEFKPIRQIGKKGDSPGSFAQPKGLALDRDGHLYVVDAHFETVQVFSAEGQLLMSFGQEGHGPGEFWLPAGMCIDRAGRIWIADTYNRRVQVFQYLPEGQNP